MAVSLQVLYPVAEGTTFDHAYYAATHFDLVGQYMGPHIASQLVTKGLAGGPDTPPGFHAIATFTFADQAAMDAALGAAGPVLEDIPKFTNSQPVMLVGEVVG